VRLLEIGAGRRFWQSNPSDENARTFCERVVQPLLAGIGALAIPGVVSGAAVGATTGGIVGGLIGIGIPEVEARRYKGKLKSGNYLIAVRTRDGDEKDRVKEIFEDAGAEDISTSSMSKAPAEARA
jgi:uncharacterized membrane protein